MRKKILKKKSNYWYVFRSAADGEMTSKVDCEVLVRLFSKARVLEDTE